MGKSKTKIQVIMSIDCETGMNYMYLYSLTSNSRKSFSHAKSKYFPINYLLCNNLFILFVLIEILYRLWKIL